MNAHIGKPTALALLLAAGLIAALFAGGLFAPAGVAAGVKGVPKPTIVLSSYSPEAEDVTATITFELNDEIDGAPLGAGADDDVTVIVTGVWAANLSDITEDDISVTQNGVSVGRVTNIRVRSGTAVVRPGNIQSFQNLWFDITQPTGGDNFVRKDVPTVVTVKGLTLAQFYGNLPDAARAFQKPTASRDATLIGDIAFSHTILDASFTRTDGDADDGLGVNDAGAKVDLDVSFRLNGYAGNTFSDLTAVHLFLPGFNLRAEGTSYTVEGTGPSRISRILVTDTATGLSSGIGIWGERTVINPEREIKVQIKGLQNPSTTGKRQLRIQQGKGDNPAVPPVSEIWYIANPDDVAVSEFKLDRSRAGEQSTMTFQFQPYVSTADDTVTVTLGGDFGVKSALAVTQEQDGKDVSVGRVAKSKDGSAFTIGKAAGDDGKNIIVGGAPVKVTVSGLVNPPDGAELDSIVTVRQGGFTPSRPLPYTILPPLRARLSASGAGAEVRVDLYGLAENPIRGGSDIDVTLPGFGIPGNLDVEDVLIYSNDYDGAPSSVQVNGQTIAITVPVRTDKGETPEPGSETTTSRTTAITGDYEIRFKSSAGLTNPTSGGKKTIKVADSDATDHEFDVTIDTTVAVKPAFVARGETTTVTVTGVRDGAVSVHLGSRDADGNDGPTLGTGEASNGVAEIEIDTAGSTLQAGATADADSDSDLGVNRIYVLDAANQPAGGAKQLGIKPTVTLGADSAKRAGTLEISVSDWYYGPINEVSIGGIEVTETDGKTITVGSDRRQTFDVTVPGDVRLGSQKVRVTGNDAALNNTTAEATVSISAIALTVTPAEVVPGQQVTITGSGFAGGADVNSIALGGIEPILPDDARSTSSGGVAVTVEVPLAIGPGAKPVVLTVGSRTGEGQITVAQPTISVSPEESLIGTRISVTGSGFASGGRVEVEYAGRVESVGEADSNGNIQLRLTVPSDAGIGSSNTVEVKVRGAESIKATAMHRTPGPRITVSPEAPVGGTIIITGTSFKSFSVLESVEIGDQNAKPSPAPETDQNGNFQFEARVPRLGVGSHTVTVEDGDQNTATETFTVIDSPVVSTPAEVFAPISEMLTVVWRYDNATGSWASYSPTGPAELNDLTAVTGGVIVWIQLTQRAEFQGQSLNSGWQLITLE